MARRGRSSVALLAAGAVGLLLVGIELLARQPGMAGTQMRTPSSLVSEVLSGTAGIDVAGWPALVVPVVLVLLLGLLIDTVSGTRR